MQNEAAKRQVQTCEEQRLDVLVPQTFWCRDTLLPITMPSITLTEKNIISVLGRRNAPCTRFGVRSGSDKRSIRVQTGNYHRKEVEELRNFLTSMKRRIVRPLKPEEPAHVVPGLQQKGWERGWVEMSILDIPAEYLEVHFAGLADVAPPAEEKGDDYSEEEWLAEEWSVLSAQLADIFFLCCAPPPPPRRLYVLFDQ